MKEEWTDKLRRKLDGHKTAPPAGLWEGISNEMGLDATPAPQPAITRKLYWVAAAMVLALIGFFALYDFDDAKPQLEAKGEITIKSSTPEERMIPEERTIPLKSKVTYTSAIQTKPSLLAMADTQQVVIEKSNSQEAVGELPVDSTAESTEPHVEPEQIKRNYLPDVIEPAVTASSAESSSKWTIGLAGSNGLLLAANDYASSTMTNPVYHDSYHGEYGNIEDSYSGVNANEKSYNLNNLPFYSLADIVSKHHIPVRFGLSIQYQLNNRLSLLSGINYSYLKSEFNIPLYNKFYNQELSYLGLPIGVSWKIWSTEKINIYLAGGALIEKCIKAEGSDGDIRPRPWQWSVNAAAGAEYNVTRLLGLYLEPSLGYYFDDGTKLEHYYKEHPLAPSIQFGIRLHLKLYR